MSKTIAPVNEIAVIRLKKCGKRFEVACYKNKFLSWKNKMESDTNEVLRSKKIFLNVSKRQMAKNTDLISAFNTDDVDSICKEILENGELQVTDKERQSELDSLLNDIIRNICDKYINPTSEWPYSLSIIEQAMKDIHFTVKPDQTAELQTIEAISLLTKSIPLKRANMAIKVTVIGKNAKKMKEKIVQHFVTLEEENWNNGNLTFNGTILPGSLKLINDILTAGTKGNIKLEVINLIDVIENDLHLSTN